jgi:hypothetical protein
VAELGPYPRCARRKLAVLRHQAISLRQFGATLDGKSDDARLCPRPGRRVTPSLSMALPA